MKNIKKLSFIGVFAMIFAVTSCSDNEPAITSRTTNYAVFEYESTVVVPVGGTFTPTAIAREDGAEIPVKNSGAVNTAAVGIYTVTYSATNADGFDATAVQTVIVHDPSIVGTDVSGTVRDKGNNSRTATISLVPGTTSIFYSTDFGFAGLFPIYFQMNGNTISAIPQTYPLAQSSVVLGYNAGTREFTVGIQPAGFSYTFEYF